MTGPRALGPRAAGWYRDPADPTRLRHWNGAGWDARGRDLPAWSIATAEVDARDLATESGRNGTVYDGPVRPAVLPATAGSSAARGARRHLAPPGGRGSQRNVRASPPWPPSAAGAETTAKWTRSRSRVVVAVSLVGVMVLTLASAITASTVARLDSSATRDTSFRQTADAACAASMDGIRVAPSPAVGPDGAATASSVAAVVAADDRLLALAARLRTAAGDSSGVAGWLAEWDAYAADRKALAQLLATDPHPVGVAAAKASALSAGEAREAALADRFSSARGLDDCSLVASTTAAASSG